jgi:hypothetical protein
MLLKGRTRTGETVHAVESLPNDPTPLGHSHGRFRPALCGALVRPTQHRFTGNEPRACKRCRALASG